MQMRNIQFIVHGLMFESNGDVTISGNVDEGAKITVTGNLPVQGIVKPGAKIHVSGDVKAKYEYYNLYNDKFEDTASPKEYYNRFHLWAKSNNEREELKTVDLSDMCYCH